MSPKLTKLRGAREFLNVRDLKFGNVVQSQVEAAMEFFANEQVSEVATERDELKRQVTVALRYLTQIAQPTLGGKLQQYAAQDALKQMEPKWPNRLK